MDETHSAIDESPPRLSVRSVSDPEMKIGCFAAAILLLLFSPVRHEVVFSFALNRGNHTKIFRLLSEVKYFPILNPTILRIAVFDGKEGEFSTEYEEYLSHFPFVVNRGFARYRLKDGGLGAHEISSNHSTCFVGKHFCLPTTSTVRIRATENSGVHLEEEINYTCPRILRYICFREILYQRMTILSGIRKFCDGEHTS